MNKTTFALLTIIGLFLLQGNGEAADQKAGMLRPVDLTCEALKNPEGIDAQPPRNWLLENGFITIYRGGKV